MKWQIAVSLSSCGVAERDCSGNHREPWKVIAWISRRRGRPQIRVFNGRRQSNLGRTSTSSTKSASKHDDWEPVNPKPAMEYIALYSHLSDDRIVFPPRVPRRRRPHDVHPSDIL